MKQYSIFLENIRFANAYVQNVPDNPSLKVLIIELMELTQIKNAEYKSIRFSHFIENSINDEVALLELLEKNLNINISKVTFRKPSFI